MEKPKPHWIEENPRTKSFMWVCSECGRVAYDSPCGSKKYQVTKKQCSLAYCPHCGVKMTGKQIGFYEYCAKRFKESKT